MGSIKKLKAPINPTLLSWARKSIGIPLPIAANKLGIKEGTLAAWESGEEKPSFPQLLKICDVYKRSPGVFFLPSEPIEPPPPKDFRVLNETLAASLSPESLIEIRRIHSKRENALEIAQQLGEEVSEFNFTTNLSANPERVGLMWRRKLGITPEVMRSWRSEYDAFNHWRQAIESLDVLVFQARTDSLDEFRGISLFSKRFPVIVLNTKDSPRGKIFTMLHEFCHLLLQVSGIGNMEPPHTGNSKINQIEVFCNAFAGACLVPATELLEAIKNHSIIKADGSVAEKAMNRFVRHFQASWEVIIRRLLHLGLLTPVEYKNIRSDLTEQMARRRKDQKGFAEWTTRRFSQNGEKFTSLVLRGASSGVITKSDVSGLLGLKLNHLDRVEALIGRRQK